MVYVQHLALIVFSLGPLAYQAHETVLFKLDPGPRYHFMPDADGTVHLVDLWVNSKHIARAAEFNPDTDTQYHLFTREHATESRSLLPGRMDLLLESDFDPERRTVFLLHGWQGYVNHNSNKLICKAFLSVEDMNVIVVDWSAGADELYVVALLNTPPAGEGVARFINWLNSETGASPADYHIIGHSLGGHLAGIIGRNVNGEVAYITGLDPAEPGWLLNPYKFQANDGLYTEVIHTNAGMAGFLFPLGQVDFYPNGGVFMPGCVWCHHARSYHYFAESVEYGGFEGAKCDSLVTALFRDCDQTDTLPMGGLLPKTGASGIYFLETNAESPFSKT